MPYYIIQGFDANGRQFVGMPIFAATATEQDIQADALTLLSDAGHECASAKVKLMKTPDPINPPAPSEA